MEIGEDGEKPSEQGENQQQIQLTHGTRATLVGGRRSRHYAIPTPQLDQSP